MTPPIGGEEVTQYNVASFLEKGKLSDLSEIKSGELKTMLEEVAKREAQVEKRETEPIDPKLQVGIDQANKRRDEEIKAAMEVNYDEVELQGIKTFYAPAPSKANKDGSRLVRNTTEENKESFSVYECKTTNPQGTTAVFKIIPSEDVAKRTESLPVSFIDPACHYKVCWKTPITSKHTTYQAGEARLEGDKRVVFKRAEIYFNGISPLSVEINLINNEYNAQLYKLKIPGPDSKIDFKRKNSFYFPIPKIEGNTVLWQEEDKDTYPGTSNSYYRLDIVDGETAYFSYFDDNKNALLSAQKDPMGMIKVTCDEVNSYVQNLTGILTLKKGKAIKKGNTWVVEEKAWIAYLY